METLTRAGLAEAVWREMGLPRWEAERFVEAAIGEMTAALAAGEKVTIVNFGSFVTRAKGPRMGRNPKTGEPERGRVGSVTINARGVTVRLDGDTRNAPPRPQSLAHGPRENHTCPTQDEIVK